MAELNTDALRMVKEAHQRFRALVQASPLQSSSKNTYLLHSENFIRCLEGEFTPGANARQRRR